MNFSLRIALPAVTAIALIGSAWADTPKKNRLVPNEDIVEARAGDVVLPNDVRGTLVMKTCLQCPLKSYSVTTGTQYYLYNQPVTLPELKAAVAATANPSAYVGVVYSPKTGEVSSVNAHAKRVARP